MGHDVLTIQDTGRAARAVPDDEVLAFAVREQRAVITLNRKHFVQLHRTGSGQHEAAGRRGVGDRWRDLLQPGATRAHQAAGGGVWAGSLMAASYTAYRLAPGHWCDPGGRRPVQHPHCVVPDHRRTGGARLPARGAGQSPPRNLRPLSDGEGLQRGRISDHLFPVERALPLPMRRGDVLFLNKRTCHGSLSNVSDEVRISFDLRYNPTRQRAVREVFPGFVATQPRQPGQRTARSRSVAELWYATRRHMADANVDDRSTVGIPTPPAAPEE